MIQTVGARARAASRRRPGCSWPPAAARNPGPRLDHLEDLLASGGGGGRGISRLNGQVNTSVAEWLSVTGAAPETLTKIQELLLRAAPKRGLAGALWWPTDGESKQSVMSSRSSIL